MNRNVVMLAAALGLAASGGAAAAEPAAPQDVLSLSAGASVEVSQDLLSVTFTTTREGQDASSVQAALKQALDAALAEAKKAARPQQVEVRTGNFSLYPRYGSKGTIGGWQGSAELTVEGRDMAAIAQLSGRIGTMTIGHVGYGLSKEAREKVESEVTAQAIGAFRARAAEMSRQFGYAGYMIREVSVSSSEGGGPSPKVMMQGRASAMAAEALPVEAGKSEVSVNVSGSVQMTK